MQLVFVTVEGKGSRIVCLLLVPEVSRPAPQPHYKNYDTEILPSVFHFPPPYSVVMVCLE